MRKTTFPFLKKVNLLTFASIFALSYNCNAQSANGVQTNTNVKSPEISSDVKNLLNFYDKQVYFTENKGQFNPRVLYRADFHLGQALATKHGIIMSMFNPDDVSNMQKYNEDEEQAHHDHIPFTEKPGKFRGQTWMLDFQNSSPLMSIDSKTKHRDVFNYFTGNSSSSETGVSSYQEVWYNNVYNNVDVRYYPSNEGSLEYDIVCKPGFDKKAIAFQLDGIPQFTLKTNGSLVLTTSVGDVDLPAPVAYQVINGKKTSVKVSYVKNVQNTLSFKIGKYDASQTLIIDPIAMRWSTWINNNSTGANHGHCIWADELDSAVYVVARVQGTTDLITPGAFDSTAATSENLIIGKYYEPDAVGGSGTRVWQTYVAGTNTSEQTNPYACQKGPDGNLYITGYTSAADFPTLGGTAFSGPSIYKGTQNPYNIFVMKINPAGNSIKSSVIGGNAEDESYDMRFTSTGQIVICGSTTSTNLATNFPGTGASNTNNGSSDVLVFKINSNLDTIIWMSNYGGSGTDVGTIMLDNQTNDDIYVAGYTASTNFPTLNPREATRVGTTDGFIQKMNKNGTTLWSSYFNSASSKITEILCMEFNTVSNAVYFGGITSDLNNNNIPATTYQHGYGGGTYDFFVAKMDTNQTFVTSTYIGGTGEEVNMMGLNTDLNNDVYVLGYTTSTNFPVSASGALQTTNLGDDDAVFLKLSTSLDTLIYSTYYGGSSDDYDPVGERGIKFSNCRIFTIVTCESNNIPLTQGALTTTKLSSTSIYEPTLVVWSNPPDLLNNDIYGNQSICKGATPTGLTGTAASYSLPTIDRDGTTSAYPNIGGTITYQWQSSTDSINWTNITGGTTQNLASSLMGPLNQTTYYRRIIGGDACVIAGPANQTVTVQIPTLGASTSTNVSCFGSNNGAITALPSGPAPYTFTWSTGATTQSVSNLSQGSYTVTVTDGSNCTYSAAFSITQPATALSANTSSNPTSCTSNSGSASATANGGTSPYTYLWSNGATTTSISNLSGGTYTITVKDAHGCSYSAPVNVSVNSSVIATASVTGNVSCNGGNNGSASVSATGGASPYTFAWSTGATTSSISNQTAGTYTLTVKDNNGCATTASVSITQPTNALAANASVAANVLCNGNNTGSAQSSPSGGTSPYTFTWSTGATTSSISNQTANTYTLTVKDNNGCSTTASLSITQPTNALAANASVTANVLCNGNNTGSAQSTPSGGTSPYTFTWSIGATTSSISNLSANTYTLTVKDNNGCSTTASISITQPTNALAANASVTANVLCNGNSTGSAQSTPSGGTSPYTFTWSTGATTSSISNQTAGTYTLTVKDKNGCSTTATVSITQPTNALAANASVTANVLCNGNSTGSAQSAPSGGTSPYTYTWSTGATTSTTSNQTAGTYTLTVKDNNGCSTTASLSITQPTNALAANASVTANVLCNGNNTGSAQSAPSGGTSPYTFTWSTGATTSTISNQTAGTYTLTVKDNNGCSTTASVSISQPTNALAANASVTANVLCNGNSTGSAQSSPSGGTTPYTYTWSTGATSSSISNQSGGTYTLTVKDKNGCSTTASVSITQPTNALAANAVVTANVLCNGNSTGSAQSAPSGGTSPYTYTWSTGATTSVISNQTAGTYTLTVKDNNGCSTTASVSISQPTNALAANASVTANILCNGNSTGSAQSAPSGGTSPYTYNWQPSGGTNPTVSGLSAGAYTLTVTDNNGCTATATATITQPNALVISIASHTNPVCKGGTGSATANMATGGTSPYSYNWTPSGGTSLTASNLSAGTYTITATDANGCTGSASVSITQPATSVTLTISTTTNVKCNGNSTGSITANAATGGITPYTYNWQPTGGTNLTASGLSGGTYTITATDKNGCTGTVSSTITQPSPIGIITSTTNLVCNGGSTGSATINLVSGGTSPYTYKWTPSGGSGLTASNLSAGNYTITITDANSCTASASVSITQPATRVAITASTTANVKCKGSSTGSITANAATGGTSPYTYSWQPSGGTNLTASGLSAGTYTITATDLNGCTGTATATITQPNTVAISIASHTNAICRSGTGSATANVATGGTSPYTYSWSPSGGTGLTASNLSAGTYTITATDVNGCTGSTLVSITQPATSVALTISTTINVKCNGGSTGSLTANAATGGTSPYTYNWQPSGGTNLTASGLSAGTYTITATDKNGCSGTVSSTITQPSIIGIITSSTNLVCNGGSTGSATVNLVSGGTSPYTYNWTPSGGSGSTASNLSAGTYTITITDKNGCSATASVTLTQPSPIRDSMISADIYYPKCNAQANGGATLGVKGGTSPYTYLWAPVGGTNPAVSNLSAGTYTITVKDNNGCSATNSLTITQPNTLVISIASQTNPLCNGGTGSATANAATGGTSPYSYNWTPGGGTGLTASNLSAGTYTITATDANGCTASASVSITQPSAALAISISTTNNVNCSGGSTGSITANAATGGTSPYTYNWQPSGGTNLTASGLSAGTYTIKVTDNNGCTQTASSSISQPLALAITIASHTNPVCNGSNTGSATANAASGGTSPYSYNWTPGGGTNLTAPNLSAGSYTITTTDLNGCTATASVTLTQPNAIRDSMISASTAYPKCNGEADGGAKVGVKNGTSPYTYSWSPVNGTTASISSLSAGTYTVYVTDKNGCTASAFITLTQPVALRDSVVLSAGPSCFGGDNGSATIGVKFGTTPYTYTWTSGISTTSSATNLKAQAYTVTVKDKNGCSGTVAFTITQPLAIRDSIVAATKVNVSCNGGNTGSATVGIKFGTSPFTYLWSPSAQTTVTASGLSVGTYSVFITDANGCTASASTSITQPGLMRDSMISANTSYPKCNDEADGGAKAGVKGGTSPYTYSWSPVSGTTANISSLSAGIYVVYVTDKNGCTTTSSITLTQPAAIRDSVVSSSGPLCFGNANGTATIGATGGTTPYTYTWSPAETTTSTATALKAQAYTVTVKDKNGCSGTVAFTLSQPLAIRDSIVAATKINVSCNGGNTGSATAGVKFGTSPYTYSWSPTAETTATATGLSAGTYTVFITDKNGCSATASTTITQTASLLRDSMVSSATVEASCNGNANGKASAGVKGGVSPYTYSWAPSGATTVSISGLSAGTYTVYVTDKNGCTVPASITITQPAILHDSTTFTCANGSTDASVGVRGGTQPYTYSWAPVSGSTASKTGLSNGSYSITVTDINGCTITTSISFSCSVAPPPPGKDGENQAPDCCPTFDNLSLYPNPNTGQFTISGLESGMMIDIYDYTGKKVGTQYMVSSQSTMQFNLSNQANGIYLVRIISKDGTLVSQKKVVKTQ